VLWLTVVVLSLADFTSDSQLSLLIGPFEQARSAIRRLLGNEITLDLVSVRWRFTYDEIENRRCNGCAEEHDERREPIRLGFAFRRSSEFQIIYHRHIVALKRFYRLYVKANIDRVRKIIEGHLNLEFSQERISILHRNVSFRMKQCHIRRNSRSAVDVRRCENAR
jgi:hypothetical protein